MIWLSHPVGNTNVRHALLGLERGGLDPEFFTTLGWRLPRCVLRCSGRIGASLQRRDYKPFCGRIHRRPWLELNRLMGGRSAPVFDRVAVDLDQAVAGKLKSSSKTPSAVYGYEDCASDTFREAAKRGVKCIYELPIAYWSTARRIYREEAERLPDWADTLGGLDEPEWKIERKTREAEQADLILCPSHFVLDSIDVELRRRKPCHVVPFGGPSSINHGKVAAGGRSKKLRVLFAGSMSQRKGLADVFQAMCLLKRTDVELVVMGSLCAPMDFYRRAFSAFRYEPPRPHAEVIELMRSCDVLVLPSLVEGRALVQQEAMACGLPVIATINAGADDLVENGMTGFIVPIRDPEALAERLHWCADHRDAVVEMGRQAALAAAGLTWESYGLRVAQLVLGVLAG